ncbi:hypothetical protein P4159_05710 [Bacillus thuringiensis]|uniref:hypothetical protein n=1 Tax=Bacillus cereus group TaxID=86661 RepID=UPI000CD90C74|nr:MULTISPECIES: hypothetical protein [Bacillus cereus group]MEC3596912.1 hypothetical protein [Bacillus thuringiensis]MED1574261.1 hypothetical protein [Bacillus paranthracis]MED1836185.1 hypothetical protein [Bacillus thuringiensis]MED2670248.1 hypothetical protein [Bacillus thuringiensis]MED2694219.1 hypothetical protein [Bacillus thuringiensis]
MFDTTGLIEKKNQKGTLYYEDSSSVIVAKFCGRCKNIKSVQEYNKLQKGLGGKKAHCKACEKEYREANRDKMKEYNKKYREENKDKMREYGKKHREKHANSTKEYHKKYYEEHKEKMKEYRKNYYKENKEEIKEYQNKYRKENTEKVKEYQRRYQKWYDKNNERRREYKKRRDRQYYLKNKDKSRVWKNIRRARKRLLPSTLTNSQNKNMLISQNNACILATTSFDLHLEHFIPVSIGYGGTTYENCYYMEGSLNLSKNASNPFEWIKTQPSEYQDRFHSILVPMLAARNEMTVEEFTEYVNWCFDNPRTIEDLKEVAI